MKTMDLKGNLLNMFVGLAMGGTEGEDLFAPFDDWNAGILYRGNHFTPETNISAIWSTVIELRISTTDAGDGRWMVSMPAPADSKSVPFPPYYCSNPLDGYRLAIAWSFFGPNVPDTFESEVFGQVALSLFNR